MVKNSFTLIEMMVVVAVILLVSGGTLALFGTMTRKQNLEKEVERIKSLLQTAQSNAMTSNTMLCSNPDTAYSYGHTVSISADEVHINPDCSTTPSPVRYKPSDQLVLPTPSVAVRFNELGHPSSNICIPLGYIGTASCSYIHVTSMGLITSGACAQCSPEYICSCD